MRWVSSTLLEILDRVVLKRSAPRPVSPAAWKACVCTGGVGVGGVRGVGESPIGPQPLSPGGTCHALILSSVCSMHHAPCKVQLPPLSFLIKPSGSVNRIVSIHVKKTNIRTSSVGANTVALLTAPGAARAEVLKTD